MSIMPAFHTRRRTSYDPFSRDARDPLNEYHFGSVAAAPHPHSYAPSHHHHHHHHHPHREEESLANAGIEWKEASEAYFIRIELRGIRREDIRVVVEDEKLLKISGHRDTDFEDRHENLNHFERSRAKFLTAFMLPEDARADQVRSSVENGVLTVTVPKRQANHRIRQVEIVV